MKNNIRTIYLVVLAVLITSSAHAQNTGGIPINVQQDKLDKSVVATAIIAMHDKNGKRICTFAFDGTRKCRMYRFTFADFFQMAKIDNVTTDSVESTLFPSFDEVLRQRENRRPNYTTDFNNRLDRIQVGPQTLFMGELRIEKAGNGDNAIFSHATTIHKERVKVFWLFETSKNRRNNLQDSLPVVIRDVEPGKEKEALIDMASSGWEFTSQSDQEMFLAMAQASQMPEFLQKLGQNDQEINSPGPNNQIINGSTTVDPTGLDAQPVVFRLAGTTQTGVAEVRKSQLLEIDYPGQFTVTLIRIMTDKTEKPFYEKTFQNQMRLPLELTSGCTYRVEVRDPANGNMMMATIRLEAK